MLNPNLCQLEIGSTFAQRFRITRLIGAGGMGAVYEAESLKGLANRAIKVLQRPPGVKEESFREQFCLEATILCKLPQDHVVQVFDFGVDEKSNLPFIEMEFLRGQNLGERIRPGRGLPPEYLLMLLGQTAKALDTIHGRGVVHRDIKPENLVVVLNDFLQPTVKIIDFGIAKSVLNEANAATTGLKGTPWYVAPEQIMGKNLGPATDRYALAQVAFTLLAGEPYWAGGHAQCQNLAQIFFAMERGTCMAASERIRLLNAEIAQCCGHRDSVTLPRGFDDWFAKATAFHPDQRFATANEMIEQLATLLLGWQAVLPQQSEAAQPIAWRQAERKDAGDVGAQAPEPAPKVWATLTLGVDGPVPIDLLGESGSSGVAKQDNWQDQALHAIDSRVSDSPSVTSTPVLKTVPRVSSGAIVRKIVSYKFMAPIAIVVGVGAFVSWIIGMPHTAPREAQTLNASPVPTSNDAPPRTQPADGSTNDAAVTTSSLSLVVVEPLDTGAGGASVQAHRVGSKPSTKPLRPRTAVEVPQASSAPPNATNPALKFLRGSGHE